MSQKTEFRSTALNYIGIWMMLIVSLGLLLLIHALPHSGLTVAAIFAIAAFNAYLMLSQFMHMSMEPGYIRWLMLGALLTILVLLVALVPDIVLVYGGKSTQ